MNILVINVGSSSIKCAFYILETPLPVHPNGPRWQGEAHWSAPDQTFTNSSGQDTLQQLLSPLWTGPDALLNSPNDIACVGHRIVHGGARYQQAVPIDREVKEEIKRCIPLAPLHNPAGLHAITLCEQIFPNAVHIAVFDTAFHHTMPQPAIVYPGPYAWFEQGIRRYGFHGINHQYSANRAAQLLSRDLNALRIITCHLGNGCSLAAIARGRSIDTTMGFTPLDGIMMGTRPGALDPGILLYLMEHQGQSQDELAHLLQKESGLKGISGFTHDMQQILQAARGGHERAQLAIELYLHRLRAGISSMIASLEGLDVLVFTGGIGEHAHEIRARACQTFAFLGLTIDTTRNEQVVSDTDISTPESTVRVVVVQAQEAWAIAQECWQMFHQQGE